jgi:hypothetical protein
MYMACLKKYKWRFVRSQYPQICGVELHYLEHIQNNDSPQRSSFIKNGTTPEMVLMSGGDDRIDNICKANNGIDDVFDCDGHTWLASTIVVRM